MLQKLAAPRAVIRKAFWDLIIVILVSVATVATIEIFFRVNETFNFLPVFVPPNPYNVQGSPSLEPLAQVIPKAPDSLVRRYPEAMKQEPSSELVLRDKYPSSFEFENHEAMTSMIHSRKGESIAVAHYTFDQYSRREMKHVHSEARDFLLALGDSFTFGEGVSNEETYPAQLNRLLTRHDVYNLGWVGFGPNDILFRLTKKPRFYWDGIRQKSGSLIYVFIPSHFERILGSSEMYGDLDYLLNKPRYRNVRGKLVQDGMLATSSLWYLILRVWNWSATFRYFKLKLPLFISSSDSDFFAMFLKEIREQYSKTFEVRDFYVVIWPGTPHSIVKLLEGSLPSTQFKILDYSGLRNEDFLRGDSNFPIDGHPTPEMYWVVSHLVAHSLENL